MAKRKSGLELFNNYYHEIYGERWETLKEALAAPHKVVAFINPSVDQKEIPSLREAEKLHEDCFELGGAWPRPEVLVSRNGEELKNYYLLDYASYLAAKSLVRPDQDLDYLDLCAAPGGKSLILASLMSDKSTLKSNEYSLARRERLRKVMDEYLSHSVRSRVEITGHDAGKWCLYEKDAYDLILLDVPCSSERHLLQKESYMKDWAPGRTKRLAGEQWKFLSSSIQVLRINGRLLYSTCSISPLENDKVMEKLFTKLGDSVRQIEIDLPIGEKTQFGHIILPDRHQHGPLYMGMVEKVGS